MRKRECDKELEFKKLFEANYTKLFYAAYHIVGNDDDARDIVNDYFASLWEHFDHGKSSYNSTFLYNGVQRRSLDFIKHAKLEEKYARHFILANNCELVMDDNENERLETIEQIIKEMPDKTRFIVDQCYIEGKKYVEVADMLGISRDGVRKHIIKALGMLRNAFNVTYKKGSKNNNS